MIIIKICADCESCVRDVDFYYAIVYIYILGSILRSILVLACYRE